VIRLLSRIFLFIIAILSLSDSGLPPRQEELRVDQHSSFVEHNHQPHGAWADTTYKLHFVGGHLSSCSVGYSAYTGLKDGDAVAVRSTRVLGNCIEIRRGGEIISNSKYWRWFGLAIGLLFLAMAFGWIKSDDEDGRRYSY
jgi:hypothetical protein